MARAIKTVPMHHDGKIIYLTIVRRERTGRERTEEFTTDFTIIPMDEEGKPLPRPEDREEAWNMIHFLMCKYMWNTSQPTQWMKELEDNSTEDRWEQVADDV